MDPIKLAKVRLVETPIWLKMGLCPPDYDKKDLAHVVGVTFGVILRLEMWGIFLIARSC